MVEWTKENSEGVTPEQMLLDWLKQPGNYQRYHEASNETKQAGIGENKLDVALEFTTLLKKEGVGNVTEHQVRGKLTDFVKKYRMAHALATSGGKVIDDGLSCPC